MTQPLTELFPPSKCQMPLAAGTLVERAALVGRLRAGLARARVVTLCAPAGSGKTWSLVQALRYPQGEGPQVFWVSLDEGDSLQRVILALLSATEAEDLPWRLSVSALAELAEDAETGPLRLADATAQAMAAAELSAGVLALDDLHRVRDPAVFRWLDRLIEHLPAQWTLVLSSRLDLPIALPKLRARHELVEFRGADLAFSEAEVEALVALHHAGETHPAAASAIRERTNGWAAGCSLAARAERLRPETLVTIRSAFEFLSSEVLDELPEGLRLFLLRSAILPELSGPVCAAVTGDPEAEARLAQIEARELFCLSLSGSPRVLRLHDLLRETLLDRLQRERPEEIPGLLRRAAACEENADRRIDYLLRAGALEEAEAETAAIAPELILQGLRDEVRRLAEAFPAEFRARSPVLAYLRGLCASSHSVWIDARRSMLAAAEGFEARGALPEANRARAHIAVASVGLGLADEAAGICRALQAETQDAETEALVAMASYWLAKVRGAAEDELAGFDRMLAALQRSDDPALWNHCALHLHLAGRVGMGVRCERYASAALAIAEESHVALRDSALCMRVWNRLFAGDWRAAEALVRELESDHYWGEKPFPVRTTVFAFRTLLAALAQDARALRLHSDRHLAEFDGREGGSWVYWRGLTLAVRGKLLLAVGQEAEVARIVDELDAALRLLPAPILRVARDYLAVGLALGGVGTAVQADLEGLGAGPLLGDVPGFETACRMMRALWLWRQGEAPAARQILRETYAECAAAGDIVYLMLLGPKMLRALIEIAQDDPPVAEGLSGFLRSLSEIAAAAKAQDQGGRIELSPREIEVLDRLARGESNKLIARAFDLSPHTVKRHVANILEKLGLSSRGQAAAWYHQNIAD